MTDIEYIRERFKSTPHRWYKIGRNRWLVVVDNQVRDEIEGKEARAVEMLLIRLTQKGAVYQDTIAAAELDRHINEAYMRELTVCMELLDGKSE